MPRGTRRKNASVFTIAALMWIWNPASHLSRKYLPQHIYLMQPHKKWPRPLPSCVPGRITCRPVHGRAFGTICEGSCRDHSVTDAQHLARGAGVSHQWPAGGEVCAMSRLSTSSKPTALPAASASLNVRISCGSNVPSAGHPLFTSSTPGPS